MPDLEDFDGFSADAVRDEIVLVNYELADVGSLACPAKEGKLKEVARLLPDRLDELMGGLWVVLRDVGGNAVKITEGAPEPPKLHTSRKPQLPQRARRNHRRQPV